MNAPATLPTRAPPPPRAAAIAGVVFAVLMGTSLIIVRLSIPANQTVPGILLNEPHRLDEVRLATQLVPFAGIAFLWFIGALRSRIGLLEDQFLSTVVFGSGLLFAGSLFASAAFSGALVESIAAGHIRPGQSDAYDIAWQLSGAYLNVFAIKMAGVFMFSTSMTVFRTRILPRWVAFSGFCSALVLITVITNWRWIALIFPAWMVLISASILVAEFRRSRS